MFSSRGAACLAVTPTRFCSSVVSVRYASTAGEGDGLPNPDVGFQSSPQPSSSFYVYST